MQLHDNTAFFIRISEPFQKESEKCVFLFCRKGLTPVEQTSGFFIFCAFFGEALKAVVRYPASLMHKGIEALFERAEQILQALDFHTCALAQFFKIFLVQRKSFVGAKSGSHFRIRIPAMVFQIIHRVVRGSDILHFIFFQKRPD